MFPPSRKLVWANLPIVNKNVVVVLLLAAFLFLISPVPILASHDLSPNQSPNSPPQRTEDYYQVVPLPSPDGGEVISPTPAPGEDYSIQQANIFEDIGSGLKSLGGKIVGLAGAAANEAIGAALYLIENALVLQIAGKAVTDTIKLIAAGDLQGVERLLVDLKNSPNPGDGGLIGAAASTTDTLVALPLPISTGRYFASISPFKNVQAQEIGGGQKGLSKPGNIILDLWVKVRNVSYILAVVALVIIGFLIMLRVPLGPRTVISAQNALPRIALALFLITFSFAISGLLIDLTRMAAKILNALVTIPFEGIWHTIVGTMIVILLAGELTGGLGGIVILAAALILALVILIGLLIIIYKLLVRYVIFLLLTIFAPLFFLVGAFPGMEGVILTWFKRAAAALLAIPVTGLVLNLSFAIGFSGVGNVPFASLNLLGGDLGQAFLWLTAAPLIGLGLFFFATKVPDMVDEAFNIRPAPRGGISPGVIIGAPLGLAMGAGSVSRGITGIQGLAADYASGGGRYTSALANMALRIPIIGTANVRDRVKRQQNLFRGADEESGGGNKDTGGNQEPSTPPPGSGPGGGRGQGPRNIPPPPGLGPGGGRGAGGILDRNRPTRRGRSEDERVAEERGRSEEETDTTNY